MRALAVDVGPMRHAPWSRGRSILAAKSFAVEDRTELAGTLPAIENALREFASRLYRRVRAVVKGEDLSQMGPPGDLGVSGPEVFWLLLLVFGLL